MNILVNFREVIIFPQNPTCVLRTRCERGIAWEVSAHKTLDTALCNKNATRHTTHNKNTTRRTQITQHTLHKNTTQHPVGMCVILQFSPRERERSLAPGSWQARRRRRRWQPPTLQPEASIKFASNTFSWFYHHRPVTCCCTIYISSSSSNPSQSLVSPH